MHLKLIFGAVSIFSMLSGGNCFSDEITVFKFSPENRENNFISIQPKTPTSDTTGFSVCLRAMFWTWNPSILFQSETIALVSFNDYSGLLYENGNYNKWFPWTNKTRVSPSHWNAICVVYNLLSSQLNITLNGALLGNDTIPNFISVLNLTDPLTIGGQDYYDRFSGQISDFNFWNRPLPLDLVDRFMFDCNYDLAEQQRPEIVNWYDVSSLTSISNTTKNFSMPREYLCDIESSSTLIVLNDKKYYKDSVSFCQRLNSKFLNENLTDREKMFLKRENKISDLKCLNQIWVENENEQNESKETQNASYGVLDHNKDMCKVLNISDNNVYNTSCYDSNCFVCKVPEERLHFKLQSNRRNDYYAEKEFLLVNDEGKVVFIGDEGQTVIKGRYPWIIYNSKLMQNFKLEEILTGSSTFIIPIGIQNYTFKEINANESIQVQLKLSNVSI